MCTIKTKFIIFTTSVVLFITGNAFCAVRESVISFDYPSNTGDFYVSGNVTFPPGVVKSEDNIIVKARDKEVPAMITPIDRWPNGSLLGAAIIFVADATDKKKYMLSFGDEINRSRVISQTAVLPTVLFSVGGAPKISENVDIDVGQINVTVDKSPGIYYYWHLILIFLIISACYIRTRNTGKTQ